MGEENPQAQSGLERMRMVFLKSSLTVFILSGAVTGAYAAPVPTGAIPDTVERIQRDQQLQNQQQFKKDMQPSQPPVELEAPVPAAPSAAPNGACRDIHSIEIVNAGAMSEEDKKAIVAAYLGKCLDVAAIERLLGDITFFYIGRGEVTTRAYLPGQDLSQGVLKILVVEGRISDLKLEGSGVNIATAFPNLKGKTLNLRDIEEGLDQLRRLASNDPTLELQPGANPGDTVVIVRNEPAKRWRISAGGDNYGSDSTGREQGFVTVSLDNLLGLNDYLTYTRRQSYLGEHSKGSRSNSVFFSVPYGRALLSAGWSDSDYKSEYLAPLTATLLSLTGDSETAFVRGDYAFYRDRLTRISFGAALTRKSTNNFVNDIKLNVSSRTITTLDAGFAATSRIGDSFVGGNIGVTRGLKLFNALEDADGLTSHDPQAQFTKLVFGASAMVPFSVAGHSAGFASQISAQLADSALYSSDQISIGGIYSVRGFLDNSLGGDNGFYARNDLSLYQPLGVLWGAPAMLRPYAALDVGHAQAKGLNAPDGTFVGAGLGLGFAAGPVSADIFAGRPLEVPQNLPDEGFNVFALLSFTF